MHKHIFGTFFRTHMESFYYYYFTLSNKLVSDKKSTQQYCIAFVIKHKYKACKLSSTRRVYLKLPFNYIE